jgi:hypothetical protein
MEEKPREIIARQHACQHLISAQVRLGLRPRATTYMCSECLVRQAVHWHHPDYNVPEWVIPLCHSCHQRKHPPRTYEQIHGYSLLERDELRARGLRKPFAKNG